MIINGDAAKVATAYVKACGEMDTILAKKGTGAYGKYMELETILAMVMPILTANGLVVTQEPTTNDFGVAVSTSIIHSSGATIEFAALTIPLTDRKPHAAGSALSYAKRYALAAVFGLAGDDDDGQAAQDSYKAKAAKTATPPVDDAIFDTPAAHAKKPDTVSPANLTRITTLGAQVYGKDFVAQSGKLAEFASQGARSTLAELKVAEGEKLIRALEKKLKEATPQDTDQPNGNGHKVAA